MARANLTARSMSPSSGACKMVRSPRLRHAVIVVLFGATPMGCVASGRVTGPESNPRNAPIRGPQTDGPRG